MKRVYQAKYTSKSGITQRKINYLNLYLYCIRLIVISTFCFCFNVIVHRTVYVMFKATLQYAVFSIVVINNLCRCNVC